MATVTVEITPAEQVRRRKIFEHAQLLVESEGLKVPAHVLTQGERYIAGEIEIEDALRSTPSKDRVRVGRSR
jgi:hypothetical protein